MRKTPTVRGVSIGTHTESWLQYYHVTHSAYLDRQATMRSLGHDIVNRVTKASAVTASGTTPVYAFGYDNMGDLSAFSQYDITGAQVMTTTCLVHDALGRLVLAGPAKSVVGPGGIGCRQASDLASVSAQFEYDAWNRRVARATGGAWTEYTFDPQGNLLAESAQPSSAAGAWSVQREYVWLDGQPLAHLAYPGPASRTDGYTYYYHLDHIGLPRALTNEAGQTVWTATPTRPYGDVVEAAGTDPLNGRTVVTNLRLPGQYDERLLGNIGIQGPYYNWNRWYLPMVGRFVELDPMALRGRFNNAYGVDWFNYASGTPLTIGDPTGLDSYQCYKFLEVLGGDGTATGPDSEWNPLHHEYLCTDDGHKLPEPTHCGGKQGENGEPSGRGVPSKDVWDPRLCKLVDRRSCVDKCIGKAIDKTSNRGDYNFVFSNCQAWANATLFRCKMECFQP